MSVKELYVTDDLDFGCLLCYLYGFEVLHVIEHEGIRATLKLAVPSEDAKILHEEFITDQTTVVLFPYVKVRAKMNRALRDAKKAGGQWTSENWRNGV